MIPKNELKDFLNHKALQYETPDYLKSDPLGLVHQFSKKEDIEIIALIISTFAWGNRKSIIKSGNKLIEIMDHHPFEFIKEYQGIHQLPHFVHRTFNKNDLHFFLTSIQSIYKESDLESCFCEHPEIRGIKGRIVNFRSKMLSIDHEKRTEKHIANPLKNSSCKRINMYLRWMVRNSKFGVDLGIWNTINSSELYIPLDVHTSRNARKLGLLKRKQNDWKALEELMNKLRVFDPNDPAKYDYALFGLGVFENF